MPYIKQEYRAKINLDGPDVIKTAGDLNWFITKTVLTYLGKNYNYQKINDVVGALECAKLELYRRLAAPYEDGAIIRNGDVY